MNSSSPTLLDDATAINTIVVLGLSTLVSVGNCIALFRRAFPKRFIADDSTIRFMSRRCQLLLIASALLLVDASNNMAHFYHSWRYRTSYSFIIARIIYLLSFPLTAPLLTHGTCQRCAVIISKYPERQKRLIKISKIACVAIVVATVSGGAGVLASMANSNASALQWFNTAYIPVYVSWSIAGYPLLAVVASGWALSSSVRRNAAKGQHPSSDQVEASSAGTGSVSVQSKPSDSSSGGAVIQDPAAKSHQPSLAFVRKPSVASLAKSKTRQSGGQGGQLSYPLSTTFVFLSVANICLWILVMYCAASGTAIGKLRSNAIMNICAAFGIAVETSFEYLVRKANRRQAAIQQNADTYTFGITTTGQPL